MLQLAMSGHALPAQAVNLQRAEQALRVIGMNPRGRLRIDSTQLLMQHLPALASRLGLQLRAQGGVGCRHISQTFQQCLEIQHGAAHQQRNTTTRRGCRHGLQGVGTKLCRRIGLRRVANIDQLMRVLRQHGLARFGRTDVHVAIDQGRIDANQLARQGASQGQGQGQQRAKPQGQAQAQGAAQGIERGNRAQPQGQRRTGGGQQDDDFGNRVEIDSQWSLRAKFGYAFDRHLLFVTAGWTQVDVDASAGVVSSGGYDKLGRASDSLDGSVYGAGYAFSFGNGWSLRAEYLRSDVDDLRFDTAYRPGSTFVDPPYRESLRQTLDFDVFRVGVDYRF